MNVVTASAAVRGLHVAVVACAVLPPLLGAPVPVLVVHMALMLNIIAHAALHDDTCVLGLIESRLRRCAYGQTIISRAFAPVLASPRMFYVLCAALLLASALRIALALAA